MGGAHPRDKTQKNKHTNEEKLSPKHAQDSEEHHSTSERKKKKKKRNYHTAIIATKNLILLKIRTPLVVITVERR